MHSEFGASGDRVKAITQLGEPADVLGVADYSLIPADVRDRQQTVRDLVRGVRSQSDHVRLHQPQQGRQPAHADELVQVLAQPGVHIGRSNPAADPSGYQILQMLKLAQGYYHDPSISASVLKNSPDSWVAETETSLLAALQTGQIDYLAIYGPTRCRSHFKYIALPPQISLSDPPWRRLRDGDHPRGRAGK